MFDHFAWSVVVVPLLVLAAGHLLVDRLRPDLAVRVFAWTTFAVGVSAALNLASFAVKALAEIPAVAVLGGWSYRIVAADSVHEPWTPWFCLAWCAAAGLAVTLAVRRHRRAVVVANRLAAALPGGDQVVVASSEVVDAFALPGRPARIVVTTAMRDLLDADQLAVVIAHERGHLDQRHHDLVWLTRLGAAIHPVLFPMVRRVEYLAERTADEAAARTVGDRRGVAEALGLVALHTRGGRRVGALHIGSRLGQTPRRVMALLDTSVQRRFPALVPLFVAVSTVVWTCECVYDLQELFRIAT
jgi:Zn-dependent protease with chaperone function